MAVDSTAGKAGKKKTGSDSILYIGLDLGTSQSAIATSNGVRINTASVVGWPKDLISFKLHQKPILFGDECQRNRMSLDLFYPLEKGVIYSKSSNAKEPEDAERKSAAPAEFIRHMIYLAEPKEKQQVYLVVGAPAEASVDDKQAIINATEGLVDSVLVVSQPFLVAYGLGMYGFTLVVDIGAGTMDICRMHGTIPGESDQKTSFKAGTFIDDMLYNLLSSKYPRANLTKSMATQFKDKYAFVGDINEQISVELIIDEKPTRCDITNEVKEACESIIPELVSTLRNLITTFDPEFQANLQENMLLAGCVSRMKGMPHLIEHSLANLGKVDVNIVEDPVFAGAIGALKLGEDMPLSEWQQM
ncbi:rod shape-determining protein [candidate division KSB1 bacterium]|nr:rod shape-determining protein [candidate division KSB1 bacterium]